MATEPLMLETDLYQDPLLDYIVEKLNPLRFTNKNLVKSLKEDGSLEKVTKEQTPSFVAEAAVRRAISLLIKEHASRAKEITFPEEIQRDDYVFRDDVFRGVVVSNSVKYPRRDLFAIDGLYKINSHPFVVEVKTGSRGRDWRSFSEIAQKHRGKDYNPGNRGIDYVVSQKHLGKVQEAFRALYPTRNMGFLLVAPSDVIDTTKPAEREFTQRGGYLATLGCPADNYRRLVMELLKK
jgi:hypothetical protein